MTITLFVKPSGLKTFLEVTSKLEQLPLDNDYVFTPSDFSFTESMISNYVWITMDVAEYLKLKCCINKLTRKHGK